jgi:DNA-binding response OmpR family regulator
MSKETILVVDDEKNIVDLVRLYLEKEGYTIESASDGEQALARAAALQPALIILDLMLPKVDGWDVCRRLRAHSQVPIIMLTARSDDVDKIVGLELGADDYLSKPFNPRELVARVRAILRRTGRPPDSGEPLRLGRLVVDPLRREVAVAGKPVELRAKEFDVLLALLQHRGLVLSREQLLNQAWGYDFLGETRTVDVHVAHLRSKLAGCTAEIETVWGVGYKLIQA